MKSIAKLLALLALLLLPCAAEAFTVPARGVEKTLAEQRRREISDLRYTLAFDIPESRLAEVEGELMIELTYTSADPLVIDFKSGAEGIHRVEVNGKRCRDYTFKNEHIIIPEKYLRRGHNEVDIDFTAGDKPLNRNEDYLYTLLVPDRARTLFPCFDQPDLKAEYNLTLEIPAAWEAVSNTVALSRAVVGDRATVVFGPTEPLSTYLFSFVVGRFDKRTAERDGRSITAYYRETDPAKVAQLDTIFNQIFYALKWLEEYTAIPYPFAKYDFVILPGFQFGGMEHTGATLYNDIRMWLGETPTLQEELDRALLIAHETSHMWFGDLVTMAWFDDVWTKEVFANYYAAEVAEPLFPDANHALNRLRTFYIPAVSEDRTPGSTPIQQELSNLEYAGLVYNNIIYNKAPVMMAKLVDIMGKEAYRDGIREYLSTYSYANATWDDLVAILDAHTPADLKSFCEVWVKEKGMPEISFRTSGDTLTVTQRDPYGRGLQWRQKSNVVVTDDSGAAATVEVVMDAPEVTVPLPFAPAHVVPNVDGGGYAYFSMGASDLDYMLRTWESSADPLMRQTSAMTIYENYLHGKVEATAAAESFLAGVAADSDPLIAGLLVRYLEYIAIHSPEVSPAVQHRVEELSRTHADKSVRLQLRRMLARIMTELEIIDEIYAEWDAADSPLWGASDYIDLSYELAIRMPERSGEIIAKQRGRITNGDKLREYDFVSRACAAAAERDAFFAHLLTLEGRFNEAYARKALAYLNHFTRDEETVKYIRPGLEALDDVRANGDIFFPGVWCSSLLSSHTCAAARAAVEEFLSTTDYPQLLKNKILKEK
jgi:aminopeptidase N